MPTADRLEQLIEQFGGRRVVILGDLVCDEFLYGDISRVSREAPVLILEHRRTDVVPGGGGNTAQNLYALDAVPIPVGIVGRDPSGNSLLEQFRRSGISTSNILTRAGYQTPTKRRVMAGGIHTRRQQIVRIDEGVSHRPLPKRSQEGLRTRLRTALRRADGLLVADYGFGAADPDVLRGVGGDSHRRSLPVTVDSRTRADQFRNVTACTPNQEELEQVLNLAPIDSETRVEEAGRKLLRRSGNQAVLVTRGARGMILFQQRRPPLHIPAYGSDEVADVTGAGDTVIAVFTLALLAGATFPEAALLANYSAGLVVMKAGTATVSRDELLRAVRESYR